MEQHNDKPCEQWDRLVILLSSQPREGWEDVYEAITHREVQRLYALETEPEVDEVE